MAKNNCVRILAIAFKYRSIYSSFLSEKECEKKYIHNIPYSHTIQQCIPLPRPPKNSLTQVYIILLINNPKVFYEYLVYPTTSI